MIRIDTSTAVDGAFIDGNPATGAPATRLNAKWFNNVQEEIVNVILAAGLPLDGANNAQLAEAIPKLLVPEAWAFELHGSCFQNGGGPSAWEHDSGDNDVLSTSDGATNVAYGNLTVLGGTFTQMRAWYTFGTSAPTFALRVSLMDGTVIANMNLTAGDSPLTYILPTPVVLSGPTTLRLSVHTSSASGTFKFTRCKLEGTR